MNYRIKEIELSDYNELIQLFKEFAHFEKYPEKMTNTVEQMEKETEFIHGFVVREKDNRVVAYVSWFYAYYTWVGKSAYIDDLYVKPEHRGKGIGIRLMNEVIDKAKETNCKKVKWQVSSWNQSAIGFYKKLGATIDNVQLNCDLILT
jgi:GNAT superfamily N-acetyltransferase